MENEFTLTEMTDHVGGVLGLNFKEMQALHRAIKNLVGRGVLRPSGTRGTGERAPDLYNLHTLCMARVFASLTAANWEVRAFRQFLAVQDNETGKPGMRRASGLENAVQAAIDGNPATVRFDILDRNRGIRGYFEHSDQPNDQADMIVANQDAAFGVPIASVTLHINALVSPILERVRAG